MNRLYILTFLEPLLATCVVRIALQTGYFFFGATVPNRPRSSNYRGFKITQRHSTLGRTPLDDWSAWRRDLYL